MEMDTNPQKILLINKKRCKMKKYLFLRKKQEK